MRGGMVMCVFEVVLGMGIWHKIVGMGMWVCGCTDMLEKWVTEVGGWVVMGTWNGKGGVGRDWGKVGVEIWGFGMGAWGGHMGVRNSEGECGITWGWDWEWEGWLRVWHVDNSWEQGNPCCTC